MSLENTLEEDILKVLWATFRPLNTLEIWESLEIKEINVPVNYLDKVLRAMARIYLLETVNNQENCQIDYRPAVSIFRFYQSPLQILQIHRNQRNQPHPK